MPSVGTYGFFSVSEFTKLKMYVDSNIFDESGSWVLYFLMQNNSVIVERRKLKTYTRLKML